MSPRTLGHVSIYDPDVRYIWPLETPTFDSFPQIEGAVGDFEGGLLLAGTFWADGRWQAALRRIEPDGSNDERFGANGVAALPSPEPPSSGSRGRGPST